MDDGRTGQVSHDAAELYERFFVPALFRPWTGPMLDAVEPIARNDRVLDVACGTGLLARAAADRIGSPERVTGLDPNEGMLRVARNAAPQIDWRTGFAEALPFEHNSFDVVLCQFGLMFFADRDKGLREMFRVLRPGGRLAVAVWDGLERSPGFAQLASLLEQVCGQAPADALRVPFSLGDPAQLAALFRSAGIDKLRIDTLPGTTRFPSLRSWIHTNVRGWSFSALVDDRQLASLIDEAQRRMQRFVTADDSVAFSTPAHVVSAKRPLA